MTALAEAIERHGFAIVYRHLGGALLAAVREAHRAALDAADPRDRSVSRSGTNTRVHLDPGAPGLGPLHRDPLLLALAEALLGRGARLNAFLSRTVHPGSDAQPLHADCPREGGRPAMVGFIFMLDAFEAGNGATRFQPGSQRGPVSAAPALATAPAGSLLVYDGAILHGFSANGSDKDRRSIQGAFVRSSGRAPAA